MRSHSWLAGIALMSSSVIAITAEMGERASNTGLAAAPATLASSAASPRAITGEDIRALLADPAIRNAVGLAENSWDFSTPDGVPGFGPIRVSAAPDATTPSCAERDQRLFIAIEDHGFSDEIAPERLAQANLDMLEARVVCRNGREAEGLALYDTALRALTVVHAAR
jgi:hypothetical protein